MNEFLDSLIVLREPNRGHHSEQFVFWSLVSIVAEMLQESIPMETLFVDSSYPRKPLLIFIDTRTRFSKLLPSKWTSLVRCYSGFQAVFTEALSSNGHICHNMLFHQHAVIEFLIKENNSFADILYQLCQFYGDSHMGASSI
jgi:hypothetical protein